MSPPYPPLSPPVRCPAGTGDRSVSRRATRCSVYRDIGLSSLLLFDIIMLHKSIICYQNDSWIFATSTCNLEKRNCTFWPFCAKKSLTNDSFFGPFHSKVAWSTDRKVCGRPTREKFFDYLDKSWSFWAIFDFAQIRAR